jgi:acetoacetyl-CoA reductase
MAARPPPSGRQRRIHGSTYSVGHRGHRRHRIGRSARNWPQGLPVVAGYYPPEKDLAEAWQQKQRADGREFEIASGDVSSFESSQEMVKDIEARVGPIDVLINCAGITRDKTFRKMEPDQWKAVISTNLDSIFNVTRQVVDGMVERGWGRIVNISSVNGQRGQFGQTNYSAAKAGAHGFTMALAQEVARKGVTVNTVSLAISRPK